MLVISDLVDSVSTAFGRLEKKEIIPIATPMRLHIDRSNPNRPILRMEKNPKYNKREWRKTCLVYSLALSMAMYRFKFEMKKQEDTIMCGWNMSFTVFAFLIARHLNKNAEAVISFFNQLFDFEQRYVYLNHDETDELVHIHGRRLMHFLIKAMTTTIVYNANLFAITAVMQPGAPGNVVPAGIYQNVNIMAALGSGTNKTEALLECGKKALSFVFSYTLWRHVSRMGILHSVIIVPIGCFMLNAAIQQFKWMIATCRNADQVDFLMFTRPYREIQYLCKFYNDLFAHSILPWNVIAIPLTLSICLYVVISNGQNMAMDALSQYISLGMVMIWTNILVFGRPVSVHSETGHMMKSKCDGNAVKFLKANKRSNARLALRTWKSFSVLKICFFGTNFFDETTPLVLFDFSIGTAINLVLLKN